MPAETKPDEPAGILRDERGRFLTGGASANPNGRPKGSGGLPTFATSVRAVAESQGVTLADAVQAVTEATLRKALTGDVAAQRLILERVPDQAAEAAPGVGAGGYAVNVNGAGFAFVIGQDRSKGPQLPDELATYWGELAAIDEKLRARLATHTGPPREPSPYERIDAAELERQRQIDELLG